MPPLALTDDELSAVQRAAASVHPQQRDAFLKALASELEQHPIVGPALCTASAPSCSVALSSRPSAKRQQLPSRANSWRGRCGAEGAPSTIAETSADHSHSGAAWISTS